MTYALAERPRSATQHFPRVDNAGEQRLAAQMLFAQVTIAQSPWVLVWDLSDRLIEAGALYELVVPLAEAVRNRRMGPYAIVVATKDQPTIEILRSLACRHSFPIFVTPDARRLDAAELATDLTPARASVFAAVRQARISTVSDVANAIGVGHTSASNVLSGLVEDGFLFRSEGSGRQGHIYLHPSSAIPAGADPATPAPAPVSLPRPLVEDLDAAASATGRPREELLAEAWREYLTSHADEMAASYRAMAELVRRGDHDALLGAVSRRARAKAERSAERNQR